ncbi:hypothetical protein [Saccharothrix algeriensis]|uniref:Secreted protein n=1 Tax=Saccharothrix algeriensis TaxID=173560 RepID=A0A8T8HWN9_9PSEU|nr:hypothetical protein [Saccharothrix algeriensis]MBM7814719.1 hypothetical protein [Saccharothrix algeriensis]QTR03005.1 hypothetical protein J7S33_29105 [Saccharothrix algeriensis]
MRRTLVAAGFAALLALSGTPTATAAPDCCWNGPFADVEQCRADAAAWRELGGGAGQCSYKTDWVNGWDGWYYRATPLP